MGWDGTALPHELSHRSARGNEPSCRGSRRRSWARRRAWALGEVENGQRSTLDSWQARVLCPGLRVPPSSHAVDAFSFSIYRKAVESDDSLENRLAITGRIFDSPPPVHPGAPDNVWGTARRCYDFMANHVRPGSRTLETGAGISTVLFTAWGCDHLAVVPYPSEANVVEAYCAEHDISTDSLEFDLRPSEVALPDRAESGELDLVFIDGCHGFPLPIIDWFYGAGRLRRGELWCSTICSYLR